VVDAAAIAGSYSDFKLVKTRSVAQIVIEVPIEQAEAFLKAFGVPQPGAEKPVALALMNTEQPKPEKPRQSWSSMSRAQQAGILCSDKQFWLWFNVDDEKQAEQRVREYFGIESRRELDAEHIAGDWDKFVSLYRTAAGQMAEQRS
jgi:hypothetical protein